MDYKNKDIFGFKLQGHGIIEVSGKDHISFLQALLTQDMKNLETSEFVWGCLLNPKSQLIAPLGLRKSASSICLFVDQSELSKVRGVLEKYIIIQDVVLASKQAPVYCLINLKQKSASLSATPFEDVTSPDLFEPARLAVGYPLLSSDYDQVIPLEVGFFHQAISMSKGCYVGQETIARLYSRGMNVSKKLVHFQSEAQVSRDASIMQAGEAVGKVTSAAIWEGQCYGLGWVKRKGFDQDLQVDGQPIHILEYPMEHRQAD